MSRPSLSEALFPGQSWVRRQWLPANVRRDLVRIAWLLIVLRLALGIFGFFLYTGDRLLPPCDHELRFNGWNVFPQIDNRGLAFPFIGVWERWDGCWYANIASHGYFMKDAVNFWPLFPALMAATAWFLGGDMALGGLMVNAVAYVLAMFGLLRLVRFDFNRAIAWRTVLYLSVFPAAFFLYAPFTEPVYLCTAVWAIYAARRRRWLLAGVAALLAGFARYQGMLLVLPIGWEALVYWWESGLPVRADDEGGTARAGDVKAKAARRRSDGLAALLDPSARRTFVARTRSWRPPRLPDLLGPALAAAMPVIAAGIFVVLALLIVGQTPFGAQEHWGGNNFHFPWDTVTAAWNWTMERHDIIEFMNVVALLFFACLLLVALFKVPFSYSLFALPQLILVATRIQPTPLMSTMRLMNVLFPAFVLLAMLGRDRRFHQVWLLLSVILLAYLVGRFFYGDFIA